MSRNTTDEKIGLFMWDWDVKTMIKDIKQENAEFKKEIADLKQEKGKLKESIKLRDQVVDRQDKQIEELKEKQEFIEKVTKEIEDLKSNMTDKHLFESLSLVDFIEALTRQYDVAKDLTRAIYVEFGSIPQEFVQAYGLDEDNLQEIRGRSLHERLQFIFAMYKDLANKYVHTLQEDDSTEPPQVPDQNESGVISIQSTFIPGKHFKRQNWIVSYNRIHEQAFCDLTGTGLFKEYYIGISTVNQQSTISVSVENAIFLDAIWHYMQELQIKSGYLYNNLKRQIQSNDCTQDMSYTVWNRFMAHELEYTLNMRPEQYKHLQDPVIFETFNNENDEEYDILKTRMVNTLDGITDDEMKLNAAQITLRLAADFFWAVRNNDWRQNYFIPFDLHQSPIVTKGLIHSVRRDAKFDEATKKIQEQYRLQNQATYVSGDNSNTEGQNSASVCVVCMDAEATHACLPCGHKCMCETCAGLVLHTTESCPMCRAKITGIIQIFGKRFNPFFIELPV